MKSQTTGKKQILWLTAILVLAALLRLWKLGSVPPGLTPDEASLGYNAYSILKTGRDEYGKLFPIIFKSFGDYKPGLYIYLTVPFVALLGLTEFAVRLPSALVGVAAVYLIYLITSELIVKGKLEIGKPLQIRLEVVATFLLAINPWHIHFSRGAWEINLALTLTLAGIYYFLKAIQKPKNLYLSAIFFAMTFLTYQGAKLSTLIVLFVLTVVFHKEIFKFEKAILTKSAITGLLISLPILASFLTGKTGRLEVFSIFSYPRPKEYTQAFVDQAGVQRGSLTYYLFYSEPLNFARGIAAHWLNHFSGRFLFFEGDWQNPRQTAPNHGVLLLIDLIFIPLGLVCLIKQKLNRGSTFILMWLILAPLPAVLSRDQVQAVRAYNLLVPFVLISTLGVLYFIKLIKNIKLRVLLFPFMAALFVGSLVYYLDAYFVHLPKHHAKNWFYGYKQAVEQVTVIQGEYNKVVFQQSYDQPYIYFLFYQRYDPVKFQKQANLVGEGVDVGLNPGFDKYEFVRFSWPAAAKKGNLVVGDEVSTLGSTSDDGYRLISEIKYPNQMVAFRILEKL